MNMPLPAILPNRQGPTMTELNTPNPAANMIDRAAQRSDAAIQAGTDAAREMAANARRAGERTVGYIQEEPVKALLIAAAAGAAAVVLFNLAARPQR